MNFNLLLGLLTESGLSPEELAPKFGMSNMTLRRWKDQPGHLPVPKSHERNIVEGIYQLLIEQRLSAESLGVQKLLAGTRSLSFQAVLKSIGVAEDFHQQGKDQQEKMMVALYQIGASEKRKKNVDQNHLQIETLKKMGSEWKKRISMLVEAVASTKISAIDKMVAYGALFYLICPIDLIPDHFPVIGFIDDFGILGFAVTFYLQKFPGLFRKVGVNEF